MLWCLVCHRQHAKENCPRLKKPSDTPLETPSHNGAYQGTLAVRVVPPGFSASDNENLTESQKASAAKGRAKQSVFARAVNAICVECGKPFTKDSSWSRRQPQHCSDKCYMKAWKRNRAKNSAQA